MPHPSKEAENIFMLCRLGAHFRYQSNDIVQDALPEEMQHLLDKLDAKMKIVTFRPR